MGRRSKREEWLPVVRDLYVRRGLGLLAIQEVLKPNGPTRNTIAAWRRHDESHGGENWDELRRQQETLGPWEELEALKKRRSLLIKLKVGDLSNQAVVSEVTQLSKEIDRVEKRLRDPDRILDAFAVLAKFTRRENASDVDRAVLRRWMAECGAALRSGRLKLEDGHG